VTISTTDAKFLKVILLKVLEEKNTDEEGFYSLLKCEPWNSSIAKMYTIVI
jgi:hypothetical protein